MAKFAKKKVSQQQAQKNIFDATALDVITELLQSPKKLFWLNFRTGFIRGFAGVLGAAIAIVAVGIIVALFGGLPYIGSFLQKIGEAIQSK